MYHLVRRTPFAKDLWDDRDLASVARNLDYDAGMLNIIVLRNIDSNVTRKYIR